MIYKVVPRVDFMLPERGEALQDVMSEGVRLGVEERPPFIYDRWGGRGEGLGALAASPDGWSASGEEVGKHEYGGSMAHD